MYFQKYQSLRQYERSRRRWHHSLKFSNSFYRQSKQSKDTRYRRQRAGNSKHLLYFAAVNNDAREQYLKDTNIFFLIH